MAKEWIKSNIEKNLTTISDPSAPDDYLRDWQNALEEMKTSGGRYNMLINGRSLITIAEGYNDFKEVADLTRFFNQVILHDFEGKGAIKKKALETLINTFHDNGLLSPVTSSISNALGSDGNKLFSVYTNSMKSNFNIQTTKDGMLIQDVCRYQSLLSRNPDIIGNVSTNAMGGISSKTIVPGQGQDYIMQAAAVIKVDLLGKKPVITIKEALAVSQDAKIKKAIVSGFMEKISDFLKDLFKLHSMKPIVKCTQSFDDKLNDAAILRQINKDQNDKIQQYEEKYSVRSDRFKDEVSEIREEHAPERDSSLRHNS